jgi:hypothetical protein
MTQTSSVGHLCLRDFGEILVTRDQGESVRQKLLDLLDQFDEVEVNLDGVEAYTPSFMDELLGKSLEVTGASRFKRQVKLVSSHPEIRKLANLVLSNRTASRA